MISLKHIHDSVNDYWHDCDTTLTRCRAVMTVTSIPVYKYTSVYQVRAVMTVTRL